MAQLQVTNGQSGLGARTAINSNFTELYGAIIVPIKLQNVSSNNQASLPYNSFILSITLIPYSGNTGGQIPIIKIGTNPGGEEVMSNSEITGLYFINSGLYSELSQILYFTYSGTGSVNIRIDYQQNYF